MASSFDFVSETSNLPQYSSVPQKYIQAPLTSNAGANIGVQNNNIESSNDNNSYYSKFKPIDTDSNNSPMPVEKPSSSIEVSSNTHHRARKKETTDSNDIVKADPGSTSVEDTSTINSYFETSTMLTNAMNQIDIVAGEIKQELDTVIGNRTMHNKYNTVVGLADNLGNLLNAKVGAIKELNNCISKSNDLDYKRYKDRKDTEGQANDDKHIMDLYSAFVKNPIAGTDMSSALGPTAMNAIYGNDIVRVDKPVGASNPDQDFTNYIANMTPEQNAMLYEQNPNIKQCVVFDASTGNKWFQVMNTVTGQVIPNAPVHDAMFMEDTTIDIKNNIAKNINLNETYPLIVINNGTAKNY